MAKILQSIVDKFSGFLFGVSIEEEEEKNVTYSITSVFPSIKIMSEVEKFL